MSIKTGCGGEGVSGGRRAGTVDEQPPHPSCEWHKMLQRKVH